MKGFLLDTNVISESMRPSPDESVLLFLKSTDGLAISVVTLHELAFGLERLPAGKRKDALQKRADALSEIFAEDALPVGRAEAAVAAKLRARAAEQGRTLHLADAFVAATALTCDLTLVTRNVQDFYGLGAELLNPFADASGA